MPPLLNTDEVDEKEDLIVEGEYDDDIEEMGELSDSPSSNPCSSRPTTPSHAITHSSSPGPSEPFSLALKAERILGLSRGSLAHAKACLENAQDEVRRFDGGAGGAGMKWRIDRARKAMSAGYGRMPSMGGKEEERHRRASEGVIYWQKEVARLEVEEKVVRK